MRKFVNGTMESLVENDDKRIPGYLKYGWKEVPVTDTRPRTIEDIFIEKAIDDANKSEVEDGLVKPQALAENEPATDKAADTKETPAVETIPQETPEEPATQPTQPTAKPKTDKIKAVASNKKVNDTIKANLQAKTEKEPVDDGLLKK